MWLLRFAFAVGLFIGWSLIIWISTWPGIVVVGLSVGSYAWFKVRHRASEAGQQATRH